MLLALNSRYVVATEVILWKRNFDMPYIHAAVTNILTLSEEKYGKATLKSSMQIEQGRAFADMANDRGIDIVVAGIDLKRESQAKPIYVPFERGVLGFRICFIHANKPSFTDIKTLDDLKEQKVRFGMGSHWPDKSIFERQGFKTVNSPKYENLFKMLMNDRFDCFARSVGEVSREMAERPEMPLKVEENLVFVYPFGLFAFVSNNNPQLQERLTYGLNKALENGSFLEIFNTYFQELMQTHGIYSRKRLFLENADMSKEALRAINQYGLADFVVAEQ
ncbi:MAG: ABC-type amino acid transport substrate-binding protein [Alphaproteobacteria bacterium]|jgi:ABC-type amino acid transport substrate-binding protein